ncbi:MAG: hydrolase, partial [Phaeodactylibacter sp.]|nr:hydrolase [Phaeodactylibacter sp.]
FTLDMTLIPDFGEARSDNQVLNLSPFEVQFDENRAFFTEGVELFNKGSFFYSRRIGGTPLRHYEVEDELGANDTLLSNPARTQLINASKISGRTESGLGIGVFNAVSARTVARIADRENLDQVRELETSPLTNYNVFVLDQNLKNNSYVSFVNTNVWRSGTAYDANVTGTVFNLRNKQNSYAIGGRGAVSQLYFSDSTGLGHKYLLSLSKTSGKFTFEFYYNEESDTYDPNDLGFLFNNNERSAGFNFNYNQYEPFGIYNEGGFGAWMGYERLYAPSVFANFNVNVWGWLVQKNFFAYGMWADVQPALAYDYFEPRVAGRYFTQVVNGASGVWISSDYRKKFALDMEVAYRKFDEPGRQIATIDFNPRYRFSDRFSMQLGLSNYYWFNDVGYVTNPSDAEIIFGRRDRVQFVNTINASYTFTNNMILTFRLRHYWQGVEYRGFYDLLPNGGLQDKDYNEFSDRSFNSFNIDAIYRWRFAPGSDFFVIWKNSILGEGNELDNISYDYGRGFGQLFELPQRNSLSLKLIYYLDYLQFKRR